MLLENATTANAILFLSSILSKEKESCFDIDLLGDPEIQHFLGMSSEWLLHERAEREC